MQALEAPCPPAVIQQALAPETLSRRAANLARLADFGPGFSAVLAAFHDHFSVLPLTPTGLRKLTSHAIQALVTRLRLILELKRSPALFEGELNEPLIIVGLGRSGTSYLHGLLSSLPGRRFLAAWEVMAPIPDHEEEDDRIAHYETLTALFTRSRPGFENMHAADARGPEECMFLLDPSLASPSFTWFDVPCPSYFEWIHEDTQREAYDVYRKLLLYLQARDPGRKLVLKSPAHFSQLSALLRAVPEARLIHTHRDPVAGLASMCSLRETLVAQGVGDFDRARIGRETLQGLESLIARNAAQRERLPEGVNYDLRFDHLVDDPLASVEGIWRHFDLPWTSESAHALRAELARGKPPQIGQHRYALRDYGLDEAEVAERLRAYRERWGFA